MESVSWNRFLIPTPICDYWSMVQKDVIIDQWFRRMWLLISGSELGDYWSVIIALWFRRMWLLISGSGGCDYWSVILEDVIIDLWLLISDSEGGDYWSVTIDQWFWRMWLLICGSEGWDYWRVILKDVIIDQWFWRTRAEVKGLGCPALSHSFTSCFESTFDEESWVWGLLM